MVTEALQSAYELARGARRFEDCRLVIEELPVVVFCSKCQAQRAGAIAAVVLLRGVRHAAPEWCRAANWKSAASGVGAMSMEPRIVEVRRTFSNTMTPIARIAQPIPRGRRLCREPGLEPRIGQNGLSGKDADPAAAQHYRPAALVGDLATENDAARLARSEAPVRQITTGTLCHLEAAMVESAIKDWNLEDLDFLFIENVGNLVCPSSFDLGEDLRLVLLSVTEGEDKPLKYPTIFNSADVAVITKIDLADAVEFDFAAAENSIQAVHPGMPVLRLSAKRGQGMDGWLNYIESKRADARGRAAVRQTAIE